MKIKSLAKFLPYATVAVIMTACGVDSDSPDLDSTSTTIPSADPQPKSESVGLSALHTDGIKWVNAENETVTLKGTNLGNWLLHEFWMMNQSSNTVATDQCTLEATFDERFGFEERERLLDMFRDNWIAERDWDILESYGLNTIRLPFIWNVIEDENNPMTLRADAWQYIDYAIEQAQARGMYVILDLHGAVGAQGWADHSGCAGQNLYWSTPEYQERTIWLWQQIAERYKDNGTVAAYGLLNEPWGTEADNLANIMIDLYKAVRETDAEKIIVLPGHHSGIDEYGHPDSFDGSNVAFEMHFYPGIFGWAEPNYETHRDWLTCGEDGTGGVCAWDAKMQSLASPLLIGEFQPWQSLGYEFGGENARATYDKFAELNWAATNWSYKVLTGDGGQGAGTWGMVTNKKTSLGLVAKASTWDCAGWDSSFSNACAAANDIISPTATGEQTYYLVVKLGTCCGGKLDITLDKISLLDDLGNEVILNGNFGSQNDWTTWAASGAPTIDFNVTDVDRLPAGSEGAALRMSGVTDTSVTEFNGGIYQAITLQGGKNYTLSGVFKDNESVNAWAEIYIVTDEPVEGKDVVAEQALPSVDFANAPIAEIESVFQLYGTVEYEIHQPLLTAMTATEASTLYTLPAKPTGLSIMLDEVGTHLSWNANQESDVTGYNIYRSTDNNLSYQLIAENITSVTYVDSSITDAHIYYYKITAVDAQDISFDSEEVVSGVLVNTLPGVVQAENWTDMVGFSVEATSDTGGGSNTGFADAGDWLEYSVNIKEAGSYQVEYRLASESGSDGFNLTLDGELIDSVTVNATGGWQSWSTQTRTLNLPVGEHILRIESLGGGWNFNWMQFSVLP